MPEKTTQYTEQTLEFVGTPRRLVAVGALPQFDSVPEISGAVAKLLAADRQPLRVRQGGRRSAALSLRLAPHTAPGTYKGVFTAGEAKTPFSVRVLPDTNLSVLAGELRFAGTAGEAPVATMAFANNGNTDIEIPKIIPVALFNDEGVETAFAASYAKPQKTLDEFFATFHAKLSESHTGIVKLAVTRGAGVYPPGATFSADFALSIPANTRAGNRFHGTANTDVFELPIALSVINGAKS